MAGFGQARKTQPRNAAKALIEDVPRPWSSTLKHLCRGAETLSRTDIFSCLCFYERPESWIFFIVGEGGSMPPVVNLQLHRHVVFIIMLEHWVVVHVDLIDMEAAYLDPKSSDTSSHPIRIRHLLVRWLEAHLDHGNIDEKLNFFEKECQQHDDTGIIAISNITALVRGYSCCAGIDPAQRRVEFIQKMKTLTRSKRPNNRLGQWTSPSGLRNAKSLFKSPPPVPQNADAASLANVHKPSQSRHPLASYMLPPATAIPPTTTSNKRKLEVSGVIPDVPAKRRQVADSTEEQKSSWLFSTWWGKKADPEVTPKSTKQLRQELEKAEADIQAIKSEMSEIEQRSGRL
ncbi:hypothetical protein MRS44_011128 [Fusarium solani]|uniref:uncharacterized protein n=1 Tax=Fusarium solani TaxID=169388 RepID=UPI0032C429D8|nr:hypothetical protein MRS44_011128 [Fusarium solani]